MEKKQKNKDKELTKEELKLIGDNGEYPKPQSNLFVIVDNPNFTLLKDDSTDKVYSLERSIHTGCVFLNELETRK